MGGISTFTPWQLTALFHSSTILFGEPSGEEQGIDGRLFGLEVSLPPAYSPSGPDNFISRTRHRILNAITPSGAGNRWGRRGSQVSADSTFGDEELEEGFGIEGIPEVRGRRSAEVREDRRLSRDLEVGFRDDSDDDSGHSATGARRNRGGG
ncbi:hypothetical protein MMC26_004846 [Xylographa opegraphella]|nr:hypothetical protein [Xylographa opegraphella]